MSTASSPTNASWKRLLERDSGWRRFLPASIVIIATALAYAATSRLGFVGDDLLQIVGNPFITSWKFLPRYFASHVWSYVYPHLLANYYRPFFLVWLRLNEGAFGQWAAGCHLTSAALHVIVTYVVYRLLFHFTLEPWAAAAGALLFGLHPVHVEAVAYVSAAPELLSCLFVLATLLFWLRHAGKGREVSAAGVRKAHGAFAGTAQSRPERIALCLGVSLLFYLAALFSKEGSLVFPILVGAYALVEYKQVGTPSKRLRFALTAIFPFLAVTVAYLPLRIWALKGFAHIVTPVPLVTEIFTIPSVLLFYMRLLVWPVGLGCYYDTPFVEGFCVSGCGCPCRVCCSGALVWEDAKAFTRAGAAFGPGGAVDGLRHRAGPELSPATGR